MCLCYIDAVALRGDRVGPDKSGTEIGEKYYGQDQGRMVLWRYLGLRGYQSG